MPDDAVLFGRSRPKFVAAWAAMAVLNLGAAVAIATWPERQTDLDTVRRWGASWLNGIDVYRVPGEFADYPPHAIVVLSPLALLGAGAAVASWASINLLLLPVAPCLALKHVNERLTISATVLPVLMFLCWSGSRTLLQFTLMALVLGLAAMVAADRRPGWSGVCLGLSLIKPQVGLPFLMWTVFARRWKVAGVSLVTIVVGIGLYCARVKADPFEVGIHYLAILGQYHVADPILVGLSELRPLFDVVLGSSRLTEIAALTGVIALFAAIAAVAFVERNQPPNRMYAAPPLAAVWSLLAVYHLTYGFLILLPLAAVLLAGGPPETLRDRKRLFWVLQLGLMFDVPGIWRRFGPPGAPVPANALIGHFDRLFILGLFIATMVLALKTAELRPAPGKVP